MGYALVCSNVGRENLSTTYLIKYKSIEQTIREKDGEFFNIIMYLLIPYFNLKQKEGKSQNSTIFLTTNTKVTNTLHSYYM